MKLLPTHRHATSASTRMQLFALCSLMCLIHFVKADDFSQRSKGDQHLEQGISKYNARLFEQSKVYFDSAAAIFKDEDNPKAFIRSTAWQMEALRSLKRYSEGIAKGEQALLEYEQVIMQDHQLAVFFYYALGLTYTVSESQSGKGFDYLKYAQQLSRRCEIDDDLVYLLYSAIGESCYYNYQYDSAINYFNKSISNFPSSRNQLDLSRLYRSTANSYWGKSEFKTASEYYDKSLEILFSMEQPDSLLIGRTIHSKGYVFMGLEDYDQALQTFKRASRYIDDFLPKVHPTKVRIYGDVGRSNLYAKNYDSALVYIQESLIANAYGFEDRDYHTNPTLESINDEFQQFMVLKLKAEALSNKYLKSGDPNDLLTIISTYELADRQIDEIRKDLSSEDQATMSYLSSETYFEAFENFQAIYQESRNPQCLELAHYYLEKQKTSQVWLRFLESSAKSKKKLPKEVMEEEEQLIFNISQLKSQVLKMHQEKNDSLTFYQDSLFHSNQVYDNFLANLKSNYPNYHDAKYDLEPVPLRSIQETLAKQCPETAMISYVSFGSKLNIEIITKDTAALLSIPMQTDLENLVGEFRSWIINPNQQDYPASGLAIYDQVLSHPLRCIANNEGIKNLVLIPTSTLRLLPFETLREHEKSPYLLERYNVSYHYSATLFTSQLQSQDRNTNQHFVGFAPNFGVTQEITSEVLETVRSGASLDPLPGAEQEVSLLSEMVRGMGFIREDATEENLKKSIKDAGLIHLATHAVVNQENPESSYLQLGETEVISEDGKLHFFEIYNLELNAQLVTLSACNTGYGKVRRGEGVMSLSRAFAYAGVPATVVSLWPASDKSTPELMRYFYQNLNDGQAKGVALNNARKQYLASAIGKAKHPFYWGGFVLIGDNSPIQSRRNLLVYLIPSMLVVVMISTVYRRKKRI